MLWVICFLGDLLYVLKKTKDINMVFWQNLFWFKHVFQKKKILKKRK